MRAGKWQKVFHCLVPVRAKRQAAVSQAKICLSLERVMVSPLADLPLNRVHPDPQQPRTWAEDELDELQAKIEGAGKILQPITVIPRADMPGHYLIKTS